MRIPFRGVILFLLTWGILWAIPTLRRQNLRVLKPLKTSPLFPPLPQGQEDIAQELKFTPNDTFLQSQKLQREWQTTSKGDTARFFHGYDALIARNPTDISLRRNRLRLSTKGPIVAMKYSPRHVSWMKSGTIYRIWLSEEELRHIVVQARAAEKLEPGDAFFPWVEAMAEWGLGSEDDALVALEKAGHCSTFNDGSADESRQMVDLLNRRHPLEWDEKLEVMSSALFPHFAGMRQLTREICYSAAEKYAAGDRTEAWRRWEAVLKAGRVVRVSENQGASSFYIGIVVAEGLEQLSWDIAAQSAGKYHFKKGEEPESLNVGSDRRMHEGAVAFAKAAQSQGHTDLASFVEREEKEIIERRTSPILGLEKVRMYTSRLEGSPETLQIYWLGFYAMLWALAGSAGYVASVLVSRAGRHSRVGSNTVIALSAFFGSLWLGVMLLGVIGGAGLESYGEVLNLSGDDNTSKTLFVWPRELDGYFWGAVIVTFLGAAFLREWGSWRNQKALLSGGNKKRFSVWQLAGLAAWVFAVSIALWLWTEGRNGALLSQSLDVLWIAGVASLLLGVVVAWYNHKQASEKSLSPLPFALTAALTIGVITLAPWVSQLDTRELLNFGVPIAGITVLAVSLLMGLTAAWRHYKHIPVKSLSPWYFAATGLAIGFFVLSAWASQLDAFQLLCLMVPIAVIVTFGHWVWHSKTGLWSRPRIATNIEIGGRVLANVALILSVGYLVVSLSLLPTRNRLSVTVDHFIQMGEINWLRSQAK